MNACNRELLYYKYIKVAVNKYFEIMSIIADEIAGLMSNYNTYNYVPLVNYEYVNCEQQTRTTHNFKLILFVYTTTKETLGTIKISVIFV